MYVNRLSNLDGLLGIPDAPAAKPDDDRARLNHALAEAVVAKLLLRYHTEFRPALQRAARSYFIFLTESVAASALYAELLPVAIACGVNRLPVVPELALTADLAVVAKALIDGGLVDANDVLFAHMPNLKTDTAGA